MIMNHVSPSLVSSEVNLCCFLSDVVSVDCQVSLLVVLLFYQSEEL